MDMPVEPVAEAAAEPEEEERLYRFALQLLPSVIRVPLLDRCRVVLEAGRVLWREPGGAWVGETEEDARFCAAGDIAAVFQPTPTLAAEAFRRALRTRPEFLADFRGAELMGRVAQHIAAHRKPMVGVAFSRHHVRIRPARVDSAKACPYCLAVYDGARIKRTRDHILPASHPAVRLLPPGVRNIRFVCLPCNALRGALEHCPAAAMIALSMTDSSSREWHKHAFRWFYPRPRKRHGQPTPPPIAAQIAAQETATPCPA